MTNATFSASPFMFGKSYRRLDFDGLICSFIIQDVIPDSLSDPVNGGFPFNVVTPYLLTLVYIPQLLPLLLLTGFAVGVVVELFKINRKGRRSQRPMLKQIDPAQDRQRKWHESLLLYLEKNREVKLSLIMLLTTTGFLVCYGLWIFFMLLHLGMLMRLVKMSVLYSEEEQSNMYSKLFLVHEMIGFAHAAIQPMILFIVLVRPSTVAGCPPSIATQNPVTPLTVQQIKLNKSHSNLNHKRLMPVESS